jgi:hypothetical protein
VDRIPELLGEIERLLAVLWALPCGAQLGSVDKARRSPASLITLITGREDSRAPVVRADEAPRFPPDVTIFRIERMGMADFGMLLPQWAHTVRSAGLASARNCDPFCAIALTKAGRGPASTL